MDVDTASPPCPVCDGVHTRSFFTLPDVPCQDGIIWPTREAAQRAPRGDIEMVYCPDCSHVFNCRFDPSKFVFDGSYNISLHHSPAYRKFIHELCENLVNNHDLRAKTVLEIGCGKADFLKAICLPYTNRGIGFDPTFTPDCLNDVEQKTISVTPAYFPKDYAGPAAELLTFRSMLQYMTDPRAFVQMVKPAVAKQGVVYAEVPNSAHIFEQLSIWNIVYEHGCFYSRQSMIRLFAECGYHVQDCFTCWVEDQNLGIEAGIAPGAQKAEFDPREVERFTKIIDRFVGEHRRRITYWQNTLDRLNMQGKRIAMWGAGARAQSFCNIFDLADSTLPFIVDINPARQGKFMPKTMQQVVAPSHLQIDKPDAILITNSGYADEIKKQIAELGLRCEMLVM